MQYEIISITDAAKIKKCSRATIYKLLREEKINSTEIAKKRLIINDDKFQELTIEKNRIASLEDRLLKIEDLVTRFEERLSKLEKQNAKLKAALHETGKIRKGRKAP